MRKMGRPLRPMPGDFIELWPTLGWEQAAEHWGAHSSMIRRWLEEAGADEMILARRRFVLAERRVANRARVKNYCLGKRLGPSGIFGG